MGLIYKAELREGSPQDKCAIYLVKWQKQNVYIADDQQFAMEAFETTIFFGRSDTNDILRTIYMVSGNS